MFEVLLEIVDKVLLIQSEEQGISFSVNFIYPSPTHDFQFSEILPSNFFLNVSLISNKFDFSS